MEFAYHGHFDPAEKFLRTMDIPPLIKELTFRKPLTQRPSSPLLADPSPPQTRPQSSSMLRSSSTKLLHQELSHRPSTTARTFRSATRPRPTHDYVTNTGPGKTVGIQFVVREEDSPVRASRPEIPIMEYFKRLSTRPARSIRTPNTNQKRVASRSGYRTKLQKDPVLRRSPLGLYEYCDCYEVDEVFMRKMYRAVNDRRKKEGR